MRMSLTIPDEYHLKVKKALPGLGYNNISDFILDAIRHQIGAGNGIKQDKVHQSGAKPQEKLKVTVDGKPAATAEAKLCKHGYLPRMCKFEECRRSAR